MGFDEYLNVSWDSVFNNVNGIRIINFKNLSWNLVNSLKYILFLCRICKLSKCSMLKFTVHVYCVIFSMLNFENEKTEITVYWFVFITVL